MSIRFGVILTFTFVCLAPEMGLAAVDCSPVKPNTGTDKTIGYKQTEADTLSKYPNADQLLLWRSRSAACIGRRPRRPQGRCDRDG